METLKEGPLLEQTMLSAGLDFYKPTMSQVAYEQEPDTVVTFTLKNRGQQRLADYIDPVQLADHFEAKRQAGISKAELDYWATITNPDGERIFTDDYLQYMGTHQLPKVEVGINLETNDIAVQSTGPWALTSLWETVIMSDINDMYFDAYIRNNDLDVTKLYEEGDRRLSEKIAALQQHPHIKITDFGTRRHFSTRWQKHVVERLMAECPDNLVGTSNVGLSQTLELTPIGTFAHEMPMVYAGLADARGEDMRESHGKFLDTWFKKYGPYLSIALTDTFTTDFFFDTFGEERAKLWRGVRHDSGEPAPFTDRLTDFYRGANVDPQDKTVVYSDALNIKKIVDLDDAFSDTMKINNGWGTDLTNDLGIPSLNIVVKATHVYTPEGEDAELVKLSDNVGKHTGSLGKVALYEAIFTKQLVKGAA